MHIAADKKLEKAKGGRGGSGKASSDSVMSRNWQVS